MIPNKVGLGLRSKYHSEVLESRPSVSWWEIHTENFFMDGGSKIAFLEKISNQYPLSFHGVGLSLGSADGVSTQYLKKIKSLVDRFNPGLVSEHISWGGYDGYHLNDLVPIPYNEEAIKVLSDNIIKAQEVLGRQILVENPSAYLTFKESYIAEEDFINEILERTKCGLLLDVNNIYVSAKNHGFDPYQYIDVINKKYVKEIHLAGHELVEYAPEEHVRIDTHSRPVCDDVWDLYKYAISKIGKVPTLIEWDSDLPTLQVLMNEGKKAQAIMDALGIKEREFA